MSDADYRIRALSGDAEVATCARMMAESEPWVTLGRTIEASIRTLQDPGKEVYVVDHDGHIEGFLVLDMRGPFPGYIPGHGEIPLRKTSGPWSDFRRERPS